MKMGRCNFLQKHIHVRLSKTLLLIQQNKNLFEGVEAGTLLFALSLMSSAMGKFGFFGVRVGVRPGLLTGKLFGTQWRPCRTAMRLSRMSIACRVLWAARSCWLLRTMEAGGGSVWILCRSPRHWAAFLHMPCRQQLDLLLPLHTNPRSVP